MNLNVSNVYFTKHEIATFEELFNQLDPNGKGCISISLLSQMLTLIGLSTDSQNLIFNSVKRNAVGYIEHRRDFYIILRLASIVHSHQHISNDLVCKFDTPPRFLQCLIEVVRKLTTTTTDRDNNVNAIFLPPPPPPTKTKLKRVHTIACTGSLTNNNNNNTNTNNNTLALSASSNQQSSSVGTELFQSSSAINHQLNRNTEKTATFSSNVPCIRLKEMNNVTIEDEDEDDAFNPWRITSDQKVYYRKQFFTLQSDIHGTVRGAIAKEYFERSNLSAAELSAIWQLADIDKDGGLSLPEFCIAMHLVVLRRNLVNIPTVIPEQILEIYTSLAKDGLYFTPYPYPPLTESSSSLSSNHHHHSVISTINKTTQLKVASSENSRKWTQFNDSPEPNSTGSGNIESLPFSEQLTEFDYNRDSIEKNPAIKHPIAVRPLEASQQHSREKLSKSKNLYSFNGLSSIEASSTNSNIEFLLNPSNDGSSEPKISLEEYLRVRYQLPPDVSNLTSDIPNETEALKQRLLTMQEYCNKMRRLHGEMLVDIVTLARLARQYQSQQLSYDVLGSSNCTSANNSDLK